MSTGVNTEGTAPDSTAPEIILTEITVPEITVNEPNPPVDITALREEIDTLDAQILTLIKRRSEVSRRIGAIRRAEGGPKIVLSREQAVLARFRELGPEGRELGMLLLRLGRGRLGRG